MNRKEHLQWAKTRALEYVEMGQLSLAVSSMQSDLSKHPETTIPPKIMDSLFVALFSQPLTAKTVAKWINDFN
jgi:hypothetical protein